MVSRRGLPPEAGVGTESREFAPLCYSGFAYYVPVRFGREARYEKARGLFSALVP